MRLLTIATALAVTAYETTTPIQATMQPSAIEVFNSSGAQSLVSTYSSKFMVSQASSTTEAGTLSPRGEHRFANGMVVGSTDFLFELVKITVENVSSG